MLLTRRLRDESKVVRSTDFNGSVEGMLLTQRKNVWFSGSYVCLEIRTAFTGRKTEPSRFKNLPSRHYSIYSPECVCKSHFFYLQSRSEKSLSHFYIISFNFQNSWGFWITESLIKILLITKYIMSHHRRVISCLVRILYFMSPRSLLSVCTGPGFLVTRADWPGRGKLGTNHFILS